MNLWEFLFGSQLELYHRVSEMASVDVRRRRKAIEVYSASASAKKLKLDIEAIAKHNIGRLAASRRYLV